MCVRVCVCALLGNTSEKFVRIFYEYLNAKTQMDIHKKWGEMGSQGDKIKNTCKFFPQTFSSPKKT